MDKHTGGYELLELIDEEIPWPALKSQVKNLRNIEEEKFIFLISTFTLHWKFQNVHNETRITKIVKNCRMCRISFFMLVALLVQSGATVVQPP
jgi:hypothetical protein